MVVSRHNGNYAGSDDLLVTAKGALFVAATSNGQDLSRRENICALTAADAREWLSGRAITDKEIKKLAPYELLEEA